MKEAYFGWLCDTVKSELYRTVCSVMHGTEFQVLVAHDDNRTGDGLELRRNYLRDHPHLKPPEMSAMMGSGVSVLEVLVALAIRADMMIPLTKPVWFQIFRENLNLEKFTDDYLRMRSVRPVYSVVQRFNNRTYTRNGRGGIFPLDHPDRDQRDVELWYQMGAYMTEKGMY